MKKSTTLFLLLGLSVMCIAATIPTYTFPDQDGPVYYDYGSGPIGPEADWNVTTAGSHGKLVPLSPTATLPSTEYYKYFSASGYLKQVTAKDGDTLVPNGKQFRGHDVCEGGECKFEVTDTTGTDIAYIDDQ